MIELRRPPGRFARVGHRGASALAPENTVEALELAVELGCDMLEFDVLALRDGTLVLAHSNKLREVTHGTTRGRVGRRTLDSLRAVAPQLPTLDDALAFCAERLPGVGLQVDLKLRGVEERVVAALERHDVLDRAWVSGFDAVSLRRIAAIAPELPRSYTLPRRRGPFTLRLRRSLPRRLPALIRRSRADAVTLQHSIVSAAAIDRAHELGAAVYVWTVDDAQLAERLVRAGADGIITNDPRIFRAFST